MVSVVEAWVLQPRLVSVSFLPAVTHHARTSSPANWPGLPLTAPTFQDWTISEDLKAVLPLCARC
jgi:hypothetical protein